jgi:formamidopyrimidine-DNA glycosylase
VPELLEVEYYRRTAERCLDVPVTSVTVVDPHCLGATTTPALGRILSGRSFSSARRRGKLLLLDSEGPTVGVRFGMTGRLVLNGRPAIERLLYAPAAMDAKWIRLSIGFADGGRLELHDPRRMGRIELDPDEEALGPDALTVTAAGLRSALSSRSPSNGTALKARLQDQARLAGVGNLLADEILWRAGLAPTRQCGQLSGAELRRLHRQLGLTLADLLRRGGSHTGDLVPERRPGGRCPRDGGTLRRDKVGGRTTWWCPRHQV